MATLSAHAVIIQHSNVRKMHWHASRPETLMLDCAEGVPYLFNASLPSEPPTPLPAVFPGAPQLSWLPASSDGKLAILAATKASFRVLYPEGRDLSEPAAELGGSAEQIGFEEGTSQDSLLDVLSGRKPLPPRTEQSYTEMVDLEVEAVDEMEDQSASLDDTFREKRKPSVKEVDPLDDSDIF